MPSYPLVRRDTDIRFQSIAQRRYFYCFSCRVFFPFVSPRVFVTFLGHFYFCFCFNLTQARVIWKEGPSSVKMPLWNWFTRAQQTVKNIPPWPLHQLLLPDLLEFQSWLPWWWTAVWKCKPNKPFPPQLASWSWCLYRNRNSKTIRKMGGWNRGLPCHSWEI